MTCLFLLGLLVLQEDRAAGGQPRLQLHQRSMRVDCQRRCLFLKRLSLGIISAYSN